ncbi:MAG: FUSC family protein, partial [Plesiomonas sp.]
MNKISHHIAKKIKLFIPNEQFNEVSVIDIFSSVLAVATSIYFSHLFRLEYATWAAFSAYVVMRPLFIQTFKRGVLRIIGTLLGG